MHLPDGILPTELVWATDLAVVTVVGWQLYQVTREELPRIALLSSAVLCDIHHPNSILPVLGTPDPCGLLESSCEAGHYWRSVSRWPFKRYC